jgi:small nuclear ribonucleoprotein (snRNP)-like protein
VVELRNDDTLRGTLAAVDADMGLHLETVSWTRLQGPPLATPPAPLAAVHVRGSRVRFVHLPGGVDPAADVETARAVAAAARAAERRRGIAAAQAAGRVPKGIDSGEGREEVG